MQRSGRIGFRTGFACVIFPLLVTAGMSLRSLPAARAGGLSNPDSYMRLVRLRDMLESGTALFTVDRDGSGQGALLHWSHLIDSLLCLLALPFSLFLGPHEALHAAALLFGPLNIAAVGFAVAWTAAPFSGGKGLYLVLGAILPALSPAIISYGLPGVVHHHAAIVLVAVVSWGIAARLITGLTPPGAALSLGAWAGLGVWLTPETLPLTMMAFGALGLAWAVYPARDDIPRALGLAGLSFLVVVTLALLADPPAAGTGTAEIDRLSVLFAGLALAIAVTGAGAWGAHGLCPHRGARLTVALLIGTGCAAVWAFLFRETLFRPHLGLDADQWHAFFDPISEMHPVTDLMQGLHFTLTGALALLIAGFLAVRRRCLFLGYIMVCATAALVCGWSHVRFAAYPEAAGAIALPIALAILGAATAARHEIVQSFARVAVILLFVQVPYLGQMPLLAGSAHAAPAAVPRPCRPADAAGLLRAHPGAVVLTDINDTPELLYRTGIRTVASLYHRNTAAFLRMRAVWRTAPSETVPPEIGAAGITLVLGCTGGERTPMVGDLERVTLYDQTRAGKPPPWLRKIAENPESGHVLYTVAR